MNIVFEPLFEGVQPPTCATSGSACLDAVAWIRGRRIACYSESNQPYELAASETELFRNDWSIPLAPGHRTRIPFGFKARLPVGYEAQVRSRSGLAWKFNIVVLQGIGTIDEDYPDEWAVLLENRSRVPFRIEHGMRVCQLAIASTGANLCSWERGVVGQTTDRAGGFGSTGR